MKLYVLHYRDRHRDPVLRVYVAEQEAADEGRRLLRSYAVAHSERALKWRLREQTSWPLPCTPEWQWRGQILWLLAAPGTGWSVIDAAPDAYVEQVEVRGIAEKDKL